MNGILNQVQSLDLAAVFHQITGNWESLMEISGIAAVILLVIAVLNCFLGLKLVKVWAALTGFGFGFLAGAGVSALFFGGMIPLIIGAVLGIALAVLFAWWHRGGVFLVAMLLGSTIAALILQPDSVIKLGICLGVGILLAIFAEFLIEPVMILLTSLFGGIAAGIAVSSFHILPETYVLYIVGIVLTVLGVLVQFMLESGRRRKQHVAKANKIREAESTENEVDRARYIIDHLDELEDEEEYEDDEYSDEDEEEYEDDEYLDDEEEDFGDDEDLDDEYLDDEEEDFEDDEYLDDDDIEFIDL